jgi:hypothetical protein
MKEREHFDCVFVQNCTWRFQVLPAMCSTIYPQGYTFFALSIVSLSAYDVRNIKVTEYLSLINAQGLYHSFRLPG